MNLFAGYYLLNTPQLMFVLLTCASIFLTPLFISGECTRRKYVISIIIINIVELAVVLYLFSKFQEHEYADLSVIDNGIARIQILYMIVFMYNNIITVKRCRTTGLKEYNYLIPGLQLLKTIGFITAVFILIKNLARDGFIPFNESAAIWIPLAVFIALTNGIQIAYLYTDERKDTTMNVSIRDKIIKYVMVCLIVIEIITAVSAMITYGYYDRFWKINSYVFTWFWLDGFAGIILFVWGMCYKITFKKEYTGFLVMPLISSLLDLIGVVMAIVNPHYDSGLDILKGLCHIIGFPAVIIFSLQDRYKINRLLIGIMSVITPLARWVVFINIWGR
jgi:hypothetical protein